MSLSMLVKKYKKKTSRCLQILSKDFPSFSQPENDIDRLKSKVLFLGNIGPTTGYDEAGVLAVLQSLDAATGATHLTLLPGKQYSFVSYSTQSQAQAALDSILRITCCSDSDQFGGNDEDKNGLCASFKQPGTAVYASFINRVPECQDEVQYKSPPGLSVLEEFITAEEEEALLDLLHWDDQPASVQLGSSLKHREVRHYGYQFQYGSNSIDTSKPLEQAPLPHQLQPIIDRMLEHNILQQRPDQLTLNRYLPGQGIPPHIDTHSACTEDLVSLSVGSAVLMDFTNDGDTVDSAAAAAAAAAAAHLATEEPLVGSSGTITVPQQPLHYAVLLPPRSLCLMTGEARYSWRHGIKARSCDVFRDGSGRLAMLPRRLRVSFTFRKTLDRPCRCSFPRHCDSQAGSSSNGGAASKQIIAVGDSSAAGIEAEHVQSVYDNIAPHFSSTRHKPWPNVKQFVCSLPAGSCLLDVGCGNGKYLGLNSDIMQVGCDSSAALLSISAGRGHQSLQCHCLALPFRDACFDAVICIAVLHHLASEARRVRGLQDLVRVLRPGGEALVYVWALEQNKAGRNSTYLRQNKKNRKHAPAPTVTDSDSLSADVEQLELNESLDPGTGLVGPERKQSEPTEKTSLDQLLPLPGDVTKAEDSHSDSSSFTNITCARYGAPEMNGSTVDVRSLPVHENRTNFLQQDVLVPWKLKPQKLKSSTVTSNDALLAANSKETVYHRFYHTFHEGELESLCLAVDDADVIRSFYDEGNWCVVLKKK